MRNNRIRCTTCKWIGKNDDLLTGVNPFDKGDIVYGCPICKTIGEYEYEVLCEVEGCQKPEIKPIQGLITTDEPYKIDEKGIYYHSDFYDENIYVLLCGKKVPVSDVANICGKFNETYQMGYSAGTIRLMN